MAEKKTFYITKWALTKGIVARKGIREENRNGPRVVFGRGQDILILKIGKDVFEELTEAKADAFNRAKKAEERAEKTAREASKKRKAFKSGNIEVVEEE